MLLRFVNFSIDQLEIQQRDVPSELFLEHFSEILAKKRMCLNNSFNVEEFVYAFFQLFCSNTSVTDEMENKLYASITKNLQCVVQKILVLLGN